MDATGSGGNVFLGGSFKYLLFSPLLGEMIHFDLRIFFKWVGSTIDVI